jgi:hypothetical protein
LEWIQILLCIFYFARLLTVYEGSKAKSDNFTRNCGLLVCMKVFILYSYLRG